MQDPRFPDAGVPNAGVTRVGLVAKTSAPLPVSSVTAVARFAELGVARNVATPVPSPLTPVLMGRPVQLVRVPLDGVPRTGLTRVGEFDKTTFVVPVEVVVPVPPLVTATVPAKVIVPVPVIGPPELVRPVVPPDTSTLVTVPAPEGVDQMPSPRQNVAALADVPEFKLATGRFPVTPVVRGRPVAFVRIPLAGMPNAGVTITGLCNVPTVVNEDAVTPDASVAPVSVPAGATTAAVVIEVVSPLALMVTTGIAVELPVVPAVATVASVPAAVTFAEPSKLGDV